MTASPAETADTSSTTKPVLAWRCPGGHLNPLLRRICRCGEIRTVEQLFADLLVEREALLLNVRLVGESAEVNTYDQRHAHCGCNLAHAPAQDLANLLRTATEFVDGDNHTPDAFNALQAAVHALNGGAS